MSGNGLSYGTTEEFMFRQEIFNKTDVELKRLNAISEHTFTVDHNVFSVMTDEELAMMKGHKHEASTESGDEDLLEGLGSGDSPVNWVEKGVVNRVKNQGHCGSCWAFGSTCSIESRNAIKTGKLVSLSE